MPSMDLCQTLTNTGKKIKGAALMLPDNNVPAKAAAMAFPTIKLYLMRYLDNSQRKLCVEIRPHRQQLSYTFTR